MTAAPEVGSEVVGGDKVHEGAEALADVAGEVQRKHVLVELVAAVHVHRTELTARVFLRQVGRQLILSKRIQLQGKAPFGLIMHI